MERNFEKQFSEEVEIEDKLQQIIDLAESKLKTWQDIAAEMGVYFAYLSEIKHGKKPGIKTYKKMLAWYEKNKH